MDVRIGFAVVPDDTPPERIVPLARLVDQHLDDLWVWEDCFKEAGVSAAAAALAVTENVHVGIGLMPTPLRNVALTAMEVATMARMFPGRLVPGIGHGVQPWMDQVGARAASPLTLLDEYATALRRLLAGEPVSVEGRYVTLREVALDWAPPPVPLFVGGTGPKTVAAAGRLGDGLLLPWSGHEKLRESATRAAEAHGGPLPVVVTVTVARGAGAAERAAEEARRWELDPEEPGIVATGSAEEVAAVLRRQVEAGATTVVVQVPASQPDVEEVIAWLGAEVAPLVRAA